MHIIKGLDKNENFEIINNKYKPYDKNVLIRLYNNRDTTKITSQITELINQNKKIAISIQSKWLGDSIYKYLKQELKINVIYYHGQNYELIETDDKENKYTMKELKQNDFQDLNNSILKCQVLLYTPVMSAGIDININHFDTFIGVQCKNYENEVYGVDGFVQSICRSWKFNMNEIYLYL